MLRPSFRRVAALASSLCVACASPVHAASGWLPCTFIPVEEAPRDVIPRCARRKDNGRLVVRPVALRALAARGTDPAAVVIGGGLHYLNAAGVAVPVLPFDNGADTFVEGLARTTRHGRIGFIDERLRVVIPPGWDFAFPFEHGTAVVCDGCRLRSAGDGHQEVIGGRWGAIDRRGRVVIPVVHSREELRRLRERRAR